MSADARDEILAGVRRALASADRSPVDVPRGYRSASPPASVASGVSAGSAALDVVGLFVERVEDYRAEVTRCSSSLVEAVLASLLRDAEQVVVPDGFAHRVPSAIPDTGQSAVELDRVDAVVTEASAGIAVTGTIVLTHGPGQGRRALSLVPDLHVCVVREEQVVVGVPDAMATLDSDRPQTWISGPSATSDIELSRVEGVHGPRRLHVVVVGP